VDGHDPYGVVVGLWGDNLIYFDFIMGVQAAPVKKRAKAAAA
jgi:hypothetical protein